MNKKMWCRLVVLLPVVWMAHWFSQGVSATTATVNDAADTETAIFAGGCFWCVESDFDSVPGVLETVSGYSGGESPNPTYKNHHQGKHREVVLITYDTSKVTFEELLHTFWRSVDPTDADGQFCDRGHSYTTAVYATNDYQNEAAVAAKEALESSNKLGKPIATVVEPASEFWPAEDYHQNYYQKNPIRYKYYRTACGRDKRVKSLWGSEAHAGIEKH